LEVITGISERRFWGTRYKMSEGAINGDRGHSESAGINRHKVGDERALHGGRQKGTFLITKVSN
jgi:hypothetical protein